MEALRWEAYFLRFLYVNRIISVLIPENTKNKNKLLEDQNRIISDGKTTAS